MKSRITLVVLLLLLLGSSYVEAKPRTRNARKTASKAIKKTAPKKVQAKNVGRKRFKRPLPKQAVVPQDVAPIPVQSFLPEFFKLQPGFRPALRLEGVGKNRSLLLKDPALLAHVREKYVESSWFGLLKQPEFGPNMGNCSTPYAKQIFINAAQAVKGRITPVSQKQIEALVTKESLCRNVESHTGPDGWGQWTKRTGLRYGLKNEAERNTPEKAVPATARHLTDLYEKFGDWDLAWWGYHSGEGEPAAAIATAVSEGMPKPISMDKLMFATTPDLYPRTYAYMRKAAQNDYAITYPYGGKAVMQIREHIDKGGQDAEWVAGLWREHQLSLEPGNDKKYASKWEAFTDWQGGTRISNPGVKLVAKTTSPVLPVQLTNMPSQELLGLYYYFTFELKEWELSKEGKFYGEVPLVRWSRVDFVLDLRSQSTVRTARIKELIRQLGMYGVLGYDQEGQSLKIAIDPKMKVWGLSMYTDNHPELPLN